MPSLASPHTTKAIKKEDRVCSKCNKFNDGTNDDFLYQIFVNINGNIENGENFKGFKKTIPNLPQDMSTNAEDIEKYLNDTLVGKAVSFTFTKKQNQDEKIINDLEIQD